MTTEIISSPTTLEGQIALVTGASRGIGQAIAQKLASQGATVIGTATSPAGAASITEALKTYATSSYGLCLDVTDSDAAKAIIEEILASHHKLSILVNNAGITQDQLALRMQESAWDAVIATNLTAVARLSRLVLRSMIKARFGRIINITSVVGTTGNAGQTNYAAAKAGVAGMSRALAREVAQREITVNCVAPGFIATDMTKILDEKILTAAKAQIPLGRFGTPEEIAAAVAFLASLEAGYITGSTLHINGGMYMD